MLLFVGGGRTFLPFCVFDLASLRLFLDFFDGYLPLPARLHISHT